MWFQNKKAICCSRAFFIIFDYIRFSCNKIDQKIDQNRFWSHDTVILFLLFLWSIRKKFDKKSEEKGNFSLFFRFTSKKSIWHKNMIHLNACLKHILQLVYFFFFDIMIWMFRFDYLIQGHVCMWGRNFSIHFVATCRSGDARESRFETQSKFFQIFFWISNVK